MGLIYKSTNGGEIGIQQIGSSVPEHFSLSQNYPNPFNPVTNIQFNIPLLREVGSEGGRGVLTMLTIFDGLGRKIAALVNENLKPGMYETKWDGSNYATGIYYYKITSGNYTETKKMIFVK